MERQTTWVWPLSDEDEDEEIWLAELKMMERKALVYPAGYKPSKDPRRNRQIPAAPVGFNYTPKFAPNSTINYLLPTAIDTSAPNCVTLNEHCMLKILANANPRDLVWSIINPATGLPDHVYKAFVINTYRRTADDIAKEALGESLLKLPRKSSGTMVAASGNAHEELPGASVLKRFRDEFGKSSDKASVLKRFREEPGESSESASVLKRFRVELGESSERAHVLKRVLLGELGGSSESAPVLKRFRG